MESGWVIKKNRISMRLLVTLLLAAGAAFWSSGCSKKLVQEPGSEIYGAAGTSVAGTFTDKRDGARYATVEIAGKTWMAVNLNYKADSSWCYNNRISNCNKYGRLYNWNTAAAACPSGWRLPYREEWWELIAAAGDADEAGKTLKSADGWEEYTWRDYRNGNGSDDYGFSALPGGERGNKFNELFNANKFYNLGSDGYWWTATEKSGDDAYYINIYNVDDRAGEDDGKKNRGFSVRCVRNDGVSPDSAGQAVEREEKRVDAEEREEAEHKEDRRHYVDEKSGRFTDSRDGRRYRAVKIGGRMWMAENLNHQTNGSWCYNNRISNCDKYGRLYNWNTAVAACPSGWRLPYREEWYDLGKAIGTEKNSYQYSDHVYWDFAGYILKSTRGWDNNGKGWAEEGCYGGGDEIICEFEGHANGIDKYGFSALPGGYYNSGSYNAGDSGALWWTGTEEDDDNAYNMKIYYNKSQMDEDKYRKTYGFSVRCIQNESAVAEEERKKRFEQSEAKKKAAEKERIEKLSGYFTDSRDGRKYRTVKIGHLRWMAENLCYKNDTCTEYGGEYDWNTANTVCPTGWRLPSRYDWGDLMREIGSGIGRSYDNLAWYGAGKKLKTNHGWGLDKGGTDDYGFSALPNVSSISKSTGEWWTATKYDNTTAFLIEIYNWNGLRGCVANEANGAMYRNYPVRCVQDDSAAIPAAVEWRKKILEKRQIEKEQRRKKREEEKKEKSVECECQCD